MKILSTEQRQALFSEDKRQPVMVHCDCGLLGFVTEPDAKKAIAYQSAVKGKRNFYWIRCPLSNRYHISDADKMPRDNYIDAIRNGKLAMCLDRKDLKKIYYGNAQKYIQYKDRQDLEDIYEAVCNSLSKT